VIFTCVINVLASKQGNKHYNLNFTKLAKMESILIISTTFETQEDAERIAKLLLERKMIACAQISSPITSLYRWQGEVAKETEYTLAMKTIPSLLKPVQKLLTIEHPYELPEIIGQEITHVNSDYLDWVYAEVKK